MAQAPVSDDDSQLDSLKKQFEEATAQRKLADKELQSLQQQLLEQSELRWEFADTKTTNVL